MQHYVRYGTCGGAQSLGIGRLAQAVARPMPGSRPVAQPSRASVVSITCLADRRRMIVKRRSVPHAARKKRRYRDEPRGLDIDPASPRFTGRLTSEVNGANGPLQMAKLIQDYGLQFSGTQVTMALARLASFATFLNLGEEQLTAQARATRRCVLLLRNKARDCDMLSYARGAYALGRLGVYDPDLMSAIVQETYDKLNLFAPEALAALIAGLGALGHRPPEGWLDRFALEVYTRFSRFTGQELAGILYGMARLRHTPSGAWCERCLEAFRAAMALPATPPLAPAMVKFAFGLATLQIKPSFNWTAAFVARARPLLDSLGPRELAVLLWALSRLLATEQQQPSAAAAALAVSVGGATAAAVGPAATIPPATPTAMVVAAKIDREFLDGWFRCAARSMANADASSLVLQLQALAALQVLPLPAKYATALLAQLQASLPTGASPSGGAESPPAYGQRQTAGILTDTENVSALLSLVALRIRPAPDWMEACLTALEPSLPSMDTAVLCDLAWAVARLQYQPSSGWVRMLVGRCNALSKVMTASQIRVIGWAFGRLEITPSKLLLRLLDTYQDEVGVTTSVDCVAN